MIWMRIKMPIIIKQVRIPDSVDVFLQEMSPPGSKMDNFEGFQALHLCHGCTFDGMACFFIILCEDA